MLVIHISPEDAQALVYWGREATDTDTVHQAARRLLTVLLDIEGKPPRYDDCPKPLRRRPKGTPFYGARVKISQTTDSAGTRALWMWGYERNCASVAASFRLLMTKLRTAYPNLAPKRPKGGHRIKCLHEFATLIEEKSHLAKRIEA